MAWTTPVIHSVGDVLASSDWNIGSNDLNYLYGDLAWSPFSVAGGFAVASGTGYIREGNIVRFRGSIVSGTSGDQWTTMPTGYRPTAANGSVALVPWNDAPTQATIGIDTSGNTVVYGTFPINIDGLTYPVV